MDEFQRVRLAVSHGPDLHFEGRVIHSYSTQNKAGTKSRWTELRLWETRAGNWVAESVGCSAHEREGEIREAAVIEFDMLVPGATREQSYTESEWIANRDSKVPERIPLVMAAFNWTTAAKAFAREMGWDVVQRVE